MYQDASGSRCLLPHVVVVSVVVVVTQLVYVADKIVFEELGLPKTQPRHIDDVRGGQMEVVRDGSNTFSERLFMDWWFRYWPVLGPQPKHCESPARACAPEALEPNDRGGLLWVLGNVV